jgi:glycosyltransferase involved in cell wall biosynthesis
MRIVLVALEFPPLNTAGSVRPFRMADLLANKGLDVTVLTLSKSEEFGIFQKPNNLQLQSDNFNLIEVNPSYPDKIRRNKVRSWFSTGDFYLDAWGEDAVNALLDDAESRGKPDFILGTCPPFSTAKLIRKMGKVLDVPYILDLRDAWSQWNVNPLTSYFHYRKVLSDERVCIKDSLITLTTSDQTRFDLVRLHQLKNVVTVENGYDVPIQFPDEIRWNLDSVKKVTIGYVGSFYYDPAAHERMHTPWYKRSPHRWLHFAPRLEDWTYRSPLYFFQILEALFGQNPAWRDKIKIEFVGNVPSWLNKMISTFDFDDIARLHGQVSLEESLMIQKKFDFFLGTSAKIHGQPDYSMGSKYYEALQFLKPIIAVCGPSPLQDLVLKGQIGIVLDPDSPQRSAEQLDAFFRKGEIKLDTEFLTSKSRSNQIDQLMPKLNQYNVHQ